MSDYTGATVIEDAEDGTMLLQTKTGARVRIKPETETIRKLEAENERLREATDEAKTALADALHGEVGGFARLSVSYARSSLNKIQALESEAGP